MAEDIKYDYKIAGENVSIVIDKSLGLDADKDKIGMQITESEFGIMKLG